MIHQISSTTSCCVLGGKYSSKLYPALRASASPALTNSSELKPVSGPGVAVDGRVEPSDETSLAEGTRNEDGGLTSDRTESSLAPLGLLSVVDLETDFSGASFASVAFLNPTSP